MENMKKAYDKYAKEREKGEMQGWKREQRQEFLQLIKKEHKQSLLEIGAGPGRDSKFFMEQGFEVIATDLSTEMVKLCKEKGLNAYELPFGDIDSLNQKFDAVWALNCLLHVEKRNLPSILDKISNVLNHEGVFFMGVYGGEDSEGIWEEDHYDPPRFFSSYTDEHIKEVVSKHFELISFKSIETGVNRNFQAMIMRKK